MSTAFDVAKHLEEENHGTLWASSGWAIHVGQEPAQPDTCITLYDTPGQQPYYADEVTRPAVQVRVRGAQGSGYLAAMQKIRAIHDEVVFTATFTVDGTDYLAWTDGAPHWLAYDDNRRPVFVCNFRFIAKG